MTKEIVLKNPTFDYSPLTKEDKSKLICFEGELTRSRKRVADEVVKHGEILAGVQDILSKHGDGTFITWLDSVGITKGSAYNAISAYTSFGGDCPNLDKLEVSAMYELAKNEPAKNKAMKLAEQGVKVTHAMAKAIIDKVIGKPNPESPPTVTPAQAAAPEVAQTEAAPPKADLGKCPNCGKTKWDDDQDGISCAACHHPHGEPAGDVDDKHDEAVKTQRSKTVKTCEALMRAFGDLNCLAPNKAHDESIESCQKLWTVAKGWK